jgi:hypothetical protein
VLSGLLDEPLSGLLEYRAMSPSERWLGAAGSALVFALAACGGEEEPGGRPTTPRRPPAGVSSLSYSPKPFSDDMHEMTVRFTTTGRAGGGREYIVYLTTGIDYHGSGCYPEWESMESPMRGGVGKTYSVVLDTDAVFDEDTFFCPGKAQLVVRTQYIEGGSGTLEPRLMRKLEFRILPRR